MATFIELSLNHNLCTNLSLGQSKPCCPSEPNQCNEAKYKANVTKWNKFDEAQIHCNTNITKCKCDADLAK